MRWYNCVYMLFAKIWFVVKHLFMLFVVRVVRVQQYADYVKHDWYACFYNCMFALFGVRTTCLVSLFVRIMWIVCRGSRDLYWVL